MTVAPTFTLEELQAFLGSQADIPLDGYKTAAEWAETLGVPESRMGRLLRQLHARGALRCERQAKTAIDGRCQLVPVYAILWERPACE